MSLFFLLGCLGKTSCFDQNQQLAKLGTPKKLEYYECLSGNAFSFADTATFHITSKDELNAIIIEICNADKPGFWKGAGWDRLKLYYADTVVTILTNKERIGLSASGKFYALEKDNFITKRFR
ncbi:hypothetical protein QNI19_36275 [Cytophagaceae bacterium DM2B3-1]|uniref:Lipoprotein n=1 Tax=Xanthocytophaga flava TaxID=3048013 RepID=A0ABT7CXF8_9BACT|nr:hypothetical protein [Xanthocytophaga flavus]MDJ1466765.1 hypothetical protein [Xanthocytophaga flavus]MDJ1498449.1 hypothetical protein [Xanthocytophaga flavus]